MRALSLLLVLAVMVSFTSCAKRRVLPLYEECVDTCLLGEHGDTYHRRGDNRLDVSCFSPSPDESYQQYHMRVVSTLAAQEQDIQTLMKGIEEKGKNIQDLKGQLSQLQNSHVDMRMALAEIEEDSEEAQKNTLFSNYTVKKGDTLQSIAYEKYGTNTGWLNLFRFNYRALPYGPNKIEVGQVLLVPSYISEAKTL